jgi:hypothetical protein
VAYVRNALQGKDEFVHAKAEIEEATQAFISSMGYLTARMGAQLLLHDKTDKRQKVLEWI